MNTKEAAATVTLKFSILVIFFFVCFCFSCSFCAWMAFILGMIRMSVYVLNNMKKGTSTELHDSRPASCSYVP